MRRLLVLAVLLAPAAAHAQRPAPFAVLDVHAGATAGVPVATLLHDYWTPGAGAALTVATPFYRGAAEAGAAAARYRALDAAQPGFTAVLAYAGWGPTVRLGPLGLHGGVRIGLHRMTFDEDTFEGVRNESELALGAVGRARLTVAGGWAVYGEAAWTKTYTFFRLHQVHLTAGVATRLATPGWLRRVLE